MAPIVTRWTAHERACKAVINGYRQFVSALATCYNERREPEALGLIMQICNPSIISTILMLMEVFQCTAPLNLVLQKGEGALCLSDLPTYLELTLSHLTSIKETCKWFTLEKFNELKNVADEQIQSLPPAARLRGSDSFVWETFKTESFYPFIDRMIEEIKEAFEQFEFWLNFEIFDPRKLPQSKSDLMSYGNEQLAQLLTHYGVSKTDRLDGKEKYVEADVNADKTKAEWLGFKNLMFQKRQAHYHSIDAKIAAVKSPDSEGKDLVLQLRKERNSFSPKMLWDSFSDDDTVKELFPNMMYLLYLLNIFPISVACVERLFSKMKLIKTRLRNKLAQVKLDQLLRIGTESPPDGFDDNVYEYFVDELKKLNPNMRIEI